MPTVTVPSDFFRSELRVYSSWKEALARELIQNSVDAQPSRISADFSLVDGHARVVFRDDGVGMSRTVLEDVFFALGRTTKVGEGVVGGFGRARIITCFAQHAYKIRTGNLVVHGQGGEYSIEESPEHLAGTEFTIDLIDDDVDWIRHVFTSFVATCSLSVPVYIDGARASMARMPARARRVLRDDDGATWAKVYTAGGYQGRVFVRVNGLNMFYRWTSGTSEDVIVELAPRRSREVLSASRDNLRDGFNGQLDAFLAALSQNRRNALATVAEPLDVRVNGGGFLTSRSPARPSATGSGQQAPDTVPGSLEAPAAPAAAFESSDRVPQVGPRELVEVLSDVEEITDDEARHLFGSHASPDHLGFDVHLMADEATTAVRKLSRAWNPANWVSGAGKRRKVLLLAWKSACESALEALHASQPSLGDLQWTVGWTFDPDSRAIHRRAGDGHVLALNPANEAGTTRYKVSRRADRQTLLAIAAHEVCHIVVSDHNETFASLLTDVFGRLDIAAADRAIRGSAR